MWNKRCKLGNLLWRLYRNYYHVRNLRLSTIHDFVFPLIACSLVLLYIAVWRSDDTVARDVKRQATRHWADPAETSSSGKMDRAGAASTSQVFSFRPDRAASVSQIIPDSPSQTQTKSRASKADQVALTHSVHDEHLNPADFLPVKPPLVPRLTYNLKTVAHTY